MRSARRLLAFLTLSLALVVAPRPAATQIDPAGPPRPRYSFDVNLDYAAATLSVGQVTRVRNQTGEPLDRVVFQVMPATLGAFDLVTASVQGQSVVPTVDGSLLELALPSSLAPGAELDLELSYRLRVPRGPGRISAGGHALALGNWFPTLAPHRGEWERHQYTEIGDAFVTEVADFDLRLTTSVPLVLAAGGEVVEADGTRFHVQAAGIRDLALSLSPDYAVAERAAGTTLVRGYAVDSSRAQLFADTAARFLLWYGARFGTYPYATLSLAEAELPPVWTGMEYPTIILLSTKLDLPVSIEGSELEELIAHETAHQWFYGLVGNDQVRAPWLDESFAEYLPFYYYRQAMPDRAETLFRERILAGLDERVRRAGNLPLDSTVYDFPTDEPYFATIYNRGAGFLDELRGTIGDAAFEAALAEEVRLFSGKLASPQAVLDLFQRRTPINLNPLFARYFSYPAVRDPEPARWQLDLPSTPWRSAAPLSVRADFSVTRLEAWLDGRLLYTGPPSAATLDLSGVEAGEYVLLVKVWDRRGVVFERAERIAVAAP